MPELAEVEFYRRQWDCGLGQRITAVELHPRKRIFRGTNTRALVRHLSGPKLVRSTARGKQMLFEFSGDNWLGVHLGMTGKLSVESPSFRPAKHDHLVLRQTRRSLIFNDARQFGRVRFHHGPLHPEWWPADLPQIGERAFTRAYLDCFLDRHRRAPIKAVLLLQSGFPGIGNWMADEILWRAKIAPSRQTGALSHSNRAALLRETRFVARESIRTIGAEFSDPPRTWLIHQRWKSDGLCPLHKTKLRRSTIGGRTTAWCSKCQPR